MENNTIIYNRAKTWQVALFVMNNSATNCFMFFIGFITYYATGVAGLGLAVVSTMVTAMRMFDGITDPIIGYVIDKTEGRFGKFRPMIFGGIYRDVSLIEVGETHFDLGQHLTIPRHQLPC